MILTALTLSVIALVAFVVYFVKRYDQVDLAASEIGKDCRNGKSFHTTVVIGGSISGLCTAGKRYQYLCSFVAALAPHSEKVIVIEKSARKENESIVPHGKAIHVVLSRGLEVLEKLFPNISLHLYCRNLTNSEQEILATKAPVVDWGTDLVWWAKGGFRLRIKEKGKIAIENILISR